MVLTIIQAESIKTKPQKTFQSIALASDFLSAMPVVIYKIPAQAKTPAASGTDIIIIQFIILFTIIKRS